MLKVISTVCFGALLVSSLSAREIKDSETFIGLEVGYSSVQGDRLLGGITIPNYSGSNINYGFHLGAQNGDWRTTLLYNYYNNDVSDQNLETGLLTIDYFFTKSKSSSFGFRPYLGTNIGYGNYESSNLQNGNGMVYGGEAGLVIDITDKIDLDISYRHSFSDISIFNHTGGVVFGVNYIY